MYCWIISASVTSGYVPLWKGDDQRSSKKDNEAPVPKTNNLGSESC